LSNEATDRNENKRRAVAAQTARSRCKVGLLSVQYVHYFPNQRLTKGKGLYSLHGVGVITKLYFAIFAAFKKSM